MSAAAREERIVGTLRDLMVEHALPLWASSGWDGVHGGFVEKLDREGRPLSDAPRRVRVQARQIYVYATAFRLGWSPAGLDLASEAWSRLRRTARAPDGRPGYVHLLDRQGGILDARRDAYDHAFVLLGLAALYRARADSQILSDAQDVLAYLDTHLASEHGGYLEGDPATLPRRQNPHMHLFEAMIAWHEATADAAFLERARDIHRLFAGRFVDPRHEALVEYFDEQWRAIEPVAIEPGHQAEWVWLLRAFEARGGGGGTARHRAMLMQAAARSRDNATGCLVDELGASGAPVKATMRLWPQTEIAKAWLAQAEGGDGAAPMEARRALARLHDRYLDHPVRGGWYDQFDAAGCSIVDDMPASSFYHVLCAVAEADRVLGGS